MAVRYGNGGARVRKTETFHPRRIAAAFGVAAGLGGFALAAGHAVAHGPFGIPTMGASEPAPPRASQPSYSVVPFEASARSRRDDNERDDERPRRNRHIISIAGGEHESKASHVSQAGYGGSQPMCVRLCDGFFFPLPVATGDVAGQTASCNSLCPDAPTEVFYRNGADTIEGSVSLSGKPYTSLPVSLRYRSQANSTCTCHRDPVAYAPLKDWTLRAGDAVMTPAGFMVFRGQEKTSHAAGEFSALSGAGLEPTTRAAMQAMERVSLHPSHPTLQQWLAQSSPTTAPVAKSTTSPVARAASAPTQVAHNDDKIRLLVWRGSQD